MVKAGALFCLKILAGFAEEQRDGGLCEAGDCGGDSGLVDRQRDGGT